MITTPYVLYAVSNFNDTIFKKKRLMQRKLKIELIELNSNIQNYLSVNTYISFKNECNHTA